jgi:hypothetical protein
MAARINKQVPKLDPHLRDFRNAIYLIWEQLGLPEPTAIQYDVANFLQHGGDRKLIMGYRGMAKTYLAAAWSVHEHRLRVDEFGVSDLATIMLSAGKDHADIVSLFCMKLISEVPFYQCLLPGPEQQSSTVKFDVGPKAVMKDPSFKSAGILGASVGSRAQRVLLDDVETPNTAGTVGMRDKLRTRVDGMADLLPPEGGVITVLGTPHFEDTLYSHLTHSGYETRIYPARYPTIERAEILGNTLAPIIREALLADPSLVGQPTDPDRFDDAALLERAAPVSKAHFDRQYMLDTTTGDRESHPLSLKDLIIAPIDCDLGQSRLIWASNVIKDLDVWGLAGDRLHSPMEIENPSLMEYTGSIMSIDPSGKGKDETSFCVAKILNSQIFVPDFGGYTAGYTEATLTSLAMTAMRWKVNAIVVESNFGGGMFESLLAPVLRKVGYPCEIIPVTNTKQKELRICDVLEPLIMQHRIIIDENAMRRDAAPKPGLGDEKAMHYRLAYQISRVTRERGCLPHDDKLDALAIACSHWVEHLSRSVEDAEQEMFDEEMQKIADEWEQDTHEEPNWNSSTISGSKML